MDMLEEVRRSHIGTPGVPYQFVDVRRNYDFGFRELYLCLLEDASIEEKHGRER